MPEGIISTARAALLVYAGAGVGMVGLVLSSSKTPVAGAALIAAGVLFVLAGWAGAAEHFASDRMPTRYVRVVDLGVVLVGIIFAALGIAQIATC